MSTLQSTLLCFELRYMGKKMVKLLPAYHPSMPTERLILQPGAMPKNYHASKLHALTPILNAGQGICFTLAARCRRAGPGTHPQRWDHATKHPNTINPTTGGSYPVTLHKLRGQRAPTTSYPKQWQASPRRQTSHTITDRLPSLPLTFLS